MHNNQNNNQSSNSDNQQAAQEFLQRLEHKLRKKVAVFDQIEQELKQYKQDEEVKSRSMNPTSSS